MFRTPVGKNPSKLTNFRIGLIVGFCSADIYYIKKPRKFCEAFLYNSAIKLVT
jgi:hypothetical protein